VSELLKIELVEKSGFGQKRAVENSSDEDVGPIVSCSYMLLRRIHRFMPIALLRLTPFHA
jgi:hypothetical protein